MATTTLVYADVARAAEGRLSSRRDLAVWDSRFMASARPGAGSAASSFNASVASLSVMAQSKVP